MHPMREYWKSAFSKFVVTDEFYQVDEMPDPILSARFVDADMVARGQFDYFNIISKNEQCQIFADYELRNRFLLGTIDIKPNQRVSEGLEIESIPLASSFNDVRQLHLLKDGFAKDFDFLKKLGPFLCKLNANYRVIFLLDGSGEPMASFTIGFSGNIAKLISGVIAKEFRGRQLSRELLRAVHMFCSEEQVKQAFYWTMSERLFGYPDHVDYYFIYQRKK